MRLQQFTLATSVATLFLVGGGVSPSFARGGKKEAGGDVPSAINKQFEWENKVVGPKEGLDHDKVAATRERGIREEQERKNKAPEKKVKVVNDPATATLPTMDIEKPAAPTERKQKKVASAQPRQRDALDNLLDEQGVKPNNPSGGGSGGLDSVLASVDRGSARSNGGKKAAKKTRRGRN
jgi:hypothetical protein